MLTSPRNRNEGPDAGASTEVGSAATNDYGYFCVEDSTRRCSNAYAVAAARLDTPSLLKMLLMCRATVFSLSPSSSAMARFVLPVATRRRTCSSRVDSPAAE